jgi:glycosyltransferase involved in cell wall biosynthesis
MTMFRWISKVFALGMIVLPKLLYLGYAFPPGVAGIFPEAQPAGHWIETNLVNSLRPWFDIRSVGISWMRVDKIPPGDPSPGLPHSLNLLDKKPQVFHRWNSLVRLKRQYLEWINGDWIPDVILVCNMSPVYNGFIRWLKRQPRPPLVMLYLADSVNLQQKYPWGRRLRHRLRPLSWPDSEMLRFMDGCVAVSRSTKDFFAARRLPWLWLPNGCDPTRAIRSPAPVLEGPVRFGYFGTLAPYGGVPLLLRVFTSRDRKSELHICGFGKAKHEIAELCSSHPRLRFYGPRTPDACLQWAQQCDVLVNPRPRVPGNENNFSSKVFEYGLSGRAILTSRVSGVDHILGPDALYFDENDFDRSLDEALGRVSALTRAELRERGANLQARLLTEYAWPLQGERLAGFINGVFRPTPQTHVASERHPVRA